MFDSRQDMNRDSVLHALLALNNGTSSSMDQMAAWSRSMDKSTSPSERNLLFSMLLQEGNRDMRDHIIRSILASSNESLTVLQHCHDLTEDEMLLIFSDSAAATSLLQESASKVPAAAVKVAADLLTEDTDRWDVRNLVTAIMRSSATSKTVFGQLAKTDQPSVVKAICEVGSVSRMPRSAYGVLVQKSLKDPKLMQYLVPLLLSGQVQRHSLWEFFLMDEETSFLTGAVAVILKVATNQHCPAEMQRRFILEGGENVAKSLLASADTDPTVLAEQVGSEKSSYRASLARNKSTPFDAVMVLSEDRLRYVQDLVALRSDVPPEVAFRCAQASKRVLTTLLTGHRSDEMVAWLDGQYPQLAGLPVKFLLPAYLAVARQQVRNQTDS